MASTPKAMRSPTPQAPVLDHACFPHILQCILDNVDPEAFPTIRSVSRALRDWTDRRISRHIVLFPEHEWGSLDVHHATDGRREALEAISSHAPAANATVTAPSRSQDATKDDGHSPHSDSYLTSYLTDSTDSWYMGQLFFREEPELPEPRCPDCRCAPSILAARFDHASTIVTRTPPLCARNTDYRWYSLSEMRTGSNEWLAARDDALQAATILDIVGEVRDIDLVAPLFNRLKTARLQNTWDLDQLGHFTAENVVLFTHGEKRADGGHVPPQLEIQRMVVHVDAPRKGENWRAPNRHRTGVRMCAWYPMALIPPASEMVYLFDPGWYHVVIKGTFEDTLLCSVVQPVIDTAIRSLTTTRFVFVGLEWVTPLAHALLDPCDWVPDTARIWGPRSLIRGVARVVDPKVRRLAEEIMGYSTSALLSPKVVDFIWTLAGLDLSEDTSVEDAKREVMFAQRQDWGGEAKRAHGAAVGKADILSKLVTGIQAWQQDGTDCPYLPVEDWPQERLREHAEERVTFLTREEYRAQIGEEQWRLETHRYEVD